jgi:hypothetical protein
MTPWFDLTCKAAEAWAAALRDQRWQRAAAIYDALELAMNGFVQNADAEYSSLEGAAKIANNTKLSADLAEAHLRHERHLGELIT